MINHIGDVIKQYRKTKEVPQMILAEAVGCTQGLIAQIENGVRRPSKELLEKICDYLNINSSLMFWLAGFVPKDIQDIKRNQAKDYFESLFKGLT